MPNEPDDKPGEEAEGVHDEDDDPASSERERPTVAPTVDLAKLAATPMARPSPAQGTAAARPSQNPHTRITQKGMPRAQLPTMTDPAELEEARKRSLPSNPVPRRPTPTGALSLANARIPSNLPPPAADAPWSAGATSGASPAELAAPAAPSEASTSPGAGDVREMNDRVSLGDYSGALAIAERLLEIDDSNDEARACAESCRSVLKQMYTARIGPLAGVPTVNISREQMRWLSIDHRAGFVLSLVDGVSSCEMILDVSGMPELDALRILSELVQQRIISIRGG